MATDSGQSIKIEKKRKTRSQSELFLIGKTLDRLTGCQLPTNKQVLQYFLHLKEVTQSNHKKVYNNVAAFDVIDDANSFWNIARIKTMSHHKAEEKLIALWKKYRNLCKRASPPPEELTSRQMELQSELDELFDLAARDAIQEIKIFV